MSDAREYELKLEIEPGSADTIRRHPAVAQSGRETQTQALTSVYFDTENLSLREAGVFLRTRCVGDRYIQTIKASEPGNLFSRGEWEQEIEGPWPDLGQAKNTALEPFSKRDLAESLKPVFETRVQRTLRRLQRNDSRIEFALDQGEIDTGKSRSPLCELELELNDGDPGELFRLARELSESAPLQLAVKSKPERGYALLDASDPYPIEKALDLKIPATMTIEEAFQVIGRSCLRQVLANRPAMLAGNAEALHQMRIGLRRLRTAISIFKDVIAGSDRERIKSELEWITGELGPPRDLDVLHAEVLRSLGDVIHQERGLAEAHQEFEERREQAYGDAKRAIRSPRFARAVLDTAEWIEVGPWTASEDPLLRLRRERPIEYHATAELARRRKKIRKQGKHLRDVDEQQRHKLRIRAKKLRYAIEFFTSVFAGEKNDERRHAALSSLKDLQSALGDLNDIAARETLMSKVAKQNEKDSDERAKSRLPFVAGVIYGSQDARAKELLKAAEKAHAEFAKVKAFWKS
jgi:inorganic triphosphatase YgiF